MYTFNPSNYITLWDWLLSFLYLGLIFLFLWIWIRIRKDDDPAYRWFIPGLAAKMAGGIFITCIYAYYYHGGDMFGYFDNTIALVKLSGRDPSQVLTFLLGDNNPGSFMSFDYSMQPVHYYMYRDDYTWAVSRFSYPFVVLGFGRILPAVILLNLVTFAGSWKLFHWLNRRYQGMTRSLAFAMFLVPSCLFWGSGLYKDTYTLAASLWLIYVFLVFFIDRRFSFGLLLAAVGCAYVIISIKPYIFIALLPVILMLLLYSSLRNIRVRFIRYLAVPLVTLLIAGGGLALYYSLAPSLGKYGSLETVLEKAAVSRDDFTQNATYSSNYFDIGSYDPTVGGILSKAPLALLYGMFGPFPSQASNAVMYISAAEAMVFMFLFLLGLRAVLFRGAYRRLVSDPVLLAFLLFVFVFIFFVGVSTANFGSLVRYRIPALPLFVFLSLVLMKRTERNA